MWDLLDPIVNFFLVLFQADRRSEGRRFTIGCFLVVVMIVGLFVLIFWDDR